MRAETCRCVGTKRCHHSPRGAKGEPDGTDDANDLAIRRALESAGVEFIDENGGGPGVRLRKRQQEKGSRRE